MSNRRWLLLILLAPGVASAAELCAGIERRIEPDMQVQESDLTTARALAAARELDGLLDEADAGFDQERAHGIHNRLQVLTGYTLRQQALEDAATYGGEADAAKRSRNEFCTWLVDEGAWSD